MGRRQEQSDMIDVSEHGCLFLGIPIDSHLAVTLANLDEKMSRLFITKEKSDYLQIAEIRNVRYLGKMLPSIIDIADYDIIAANLLSLLKLIMPQHSLTKAHLMLLAHLPE